MIEKEMYAICSQALANTPPGSGLQGNSQGGSIWRLQCGRQNSKNNHCHLCHRMHSGSIGKSKQKISGPLITIHIFY